MRRALNLCFFLLFMTGAGWAADSGAPLAASFDGAVLRITGVTPGGTVALDGALLEPQSEVHERQLRIEQTIADPDRDGIVTYTYERNIPRQSIWGVVDIASGRYVIATPPTYRRQELPFPSNAVKNTPADEFDELTHGFFLLQVLWVRPGEGAWVSMSADGGAGDSDKKNNGKTETSLSYFRPISANTPVPKKIKKDDVLIFIDAFDMAFTSTKVTK